MSATSTPNGVFDAVTGVLTAVRRSLLLAMIVFGLALIILGMTVMSGIYAGLFGLWGALAVVVALLGIGSIQLLKRL